MSNVLKQIDPIWLYISMFIVGIFAVIRFAIAGAFTNSSLAIGLSVGFFAMGCFVFFLDRFFKFFPRTDAGTKSTTFSTHLHSFWIGALLIGGGMWLLGTLFPTFSIYTSPFQITGTLLATATEGLGIFDTISANTIMAPIMETYVFIGHFFISWLVVRTLGKMAGFSDTVIKAITIGFFIIFSASTFYFFHVGIVGSTAFLVAVFVYRGLMALTWVGDKFFNLIPIFSITLAVEFGYHWMNNILNTVGFFEWVTVMSSDIFGFVALLYFTLFLGGLEIYNIKAGGDKE